MAEQDISSFEFSDDDDTFLDYLCQANERPVPPSYLEWLCDALATARQPQEEQQEHDLEEAEQEEKDEAAKEEKQDKQSVF